MDFTLLFTNFITVNKYRFCISVIGYIIIQIIGNKKINIGRSLVQSYIQTQSTGFLVRHCWRYSCSSAEKMKESVRAEGWNYSYAGSTPVAEPSEIWHHTAERIKMAGLVRLTWFKGDWKMRSGWIFIIVGWLCSHTAIIHLCPNTM